MKEFKDKVAIITGAASGIGRAIAERCAQEGMKVVLADVEQTPLAQAQAELEATGATVLAIQTDVAKASDIEILAQKTINSFGAVHVLFNNAGVSVDTTIPAWENTLADWEWVLGVNLWGVIHGMRIFVPIMLKQDTECYIVNTASMAGLVSGPGGAAYRVTKHGVVALSETLYHELARKGAKVHISVLCPLWVKTRILDSGRNRPTELQNEPTDRQISREDKVTGLTIHRAIRDGMPPLQVADYVFSGLRERKFYILTHADAKPLVQTRMEDILQERNPT